jgi:hypothetical protein
VSSALFRYSSHTAYLNAYNGDLFTQTGSGHTQDRENNLNANDVSMTQLSRRHAADNRDRDCG